MYTRIRNFKVPVSCHECVVNNRGVCDIELDTIIKQDTYISKRHPDCPIECVTLLDKLKARLKKG